MTTKEANTLDISDTTTTNTNPLEAKPLDKANAVSSKPHIPSVSASAVLGESSSMPEGTPICKGVDFGGGDDAASDDDMLSQMMKAFRYTGFQATNLGLAIEQVRKQTKQNGSSVQICKPVQVASAPGQ